MFQASYDWTTRIATAAVAAFLVGIVLLVHSILAAAVAAGLMIAAYAWSPRGYTIGGRSIAVSRLAGAARFSLEGLRVARRATREDLSGAVRLWASGGVFGYYGLFQTAGLGRSRWYVTNRRNAVVVTADEGTALFSPDDVDGFLAAVGDVAPAAGPPPGKAAGQWIGIAIAAVALSVAGFAVLYSPGPPAYTLARDTLAIHDRFYPVTLGAASVDVPEIRVVDIVSDPQWRPTARTNGFANAHYHSGWFRAANGQKTRMYWANGTRLVLLPAKGSGAAVLLEVRDPEAFIQRIRREWD